MWRAGPCGKNAQRPKLASHVAQHTAAACTCFASGQAVAGCEAIPCALPCCLRWPWPLLPTAAVLVYDGQKTRRAVMKTCSAT